MGNYLIIDAIASRGKPPVVAPNTADQSIGDPHN
ncbi:hypothetical protein BMF77_03073 [Dolichospermum sp. UHCC 0315A]|jgi:hypothetical protein|nr:hypothetical protein BMF77_03073 [Dolichospermum sp. UHCC 0315A]